MPKKHAFNNMQRAFTHEEIKCSFTRITVDLSPNMTPVISVCLQTLINAVWVANDPSAINK